MNFSVAIRGLTAALSLSLVACAPQLDRDVGAASEGRSAIDPAHAVMSMWIGHFGLSRYPGRVAGVSGTLDFVPAASAASRLAIAIPARAIDLVVEIEFLATH